MQGRVGLLKGSIVWQRHFGEEQEDNNNRIGRILQVRNWHSGSRRMSKLLGTSDEEKKKKKKKQQPE
jgi:hypothetical protein